MAWGKSMWLDAKGCDHFSICSSGIIKNFMKELVKRIDMVAHGEPIIEHFGVDEKLGYSIVQLIETSSITCHFSEDTDCLYLDVFSCKDFDDEVVCQVVREFFITNEIVSNYTWRGLF